MKSSDLPTQQGRSFQSSGGVLIGWLSLVAAATVSGRAQQPTLPATAGQTHFVSRSVPRPGCLRSKAQRALNAVAASWTWSHLSLLALSSGRGR